MLQQVESLKYISREVSYENGQDVQQKIGKFAHILGILNNTF
jgi:hypothetical protein